MSDPKPLRTKAEIEKDLAQAYAEFGEMTYRAKVFESQAQGKAQFISSLHSEQPVLETATLKVVDAEVVE